MKEEYGKEGICWNCWNVALEDRGLTKEPTEEKLLALIRELHPIEHPIHECRCGHSWPA
jgi:hypothetical protein